MEIRIRPARPSDAPIIGEAIMDAIGAEARLKLAGTIERIPLVIQVFTELAEQEDSQYSFRNALIAESETGEPAGAIVAYDGAELHRLRLAFIKKVADVLDMHIDPETMADETSDDEIYLDTLAVLPAFRRQGIARKLILAMAEKHAGSKPLGLLCEDGNDNAYALYSKIGFKKVGMRPFAGIEMHHMVLAN